jgi:signal transduction histidine kinase
LPKSTTRTSVLFVVWLLLMITCIVSSFAQVSDSSVTADPSWEEVKKQKSGTVTAYWYESRPFIYQDINGSMWGLEYELLEGFREFLRETHDINLTINWKEAESFNDTYNTFRDRKPHVTFGASAFSITEKRTEIIDFSPPYMSDICVLITSEDIPIVKDISEFNSLLPHLTAITIKGTTYEQDLMRLQTQGQMFFDVEYIPSSSNIMHTIARTDSAFGFIDLPVYMMILNEDPSVKVKRQNFLPIRREGYAIVMKKNSDWNIPIQQYFNDTRFRSRLEKIIAHYIDLDLYHFVEGLAVQSNDEMVSLLTKEKEIQYRGLLGKTQEVIEETRMRNFLIILLAVIFGFLIIIFFLYKKTNGQKDEIEEQRKKLEAKTEQVEQRNEHLLALDEEKNNLIKILAHDLRTPITQIQGLAQLVLLENSTLSPDQNLMVNKITESAIRLNKMITHILDLEALEHNQVTVFREELNINALVQQVVNSFEKEAHKKNIQILYNSHCEGCKIKGDSLFLIQVLENLISNAIKFSPAGKTVSVNVREATAKLLISVKDNGPGLTPEDQQHLFKKFQRLTARPTAGEGSFGLGLSIVKKYTDLMGGNVRCVSSLNEGAEFILEFDKLHEA